MHGALRHPAVTAAVAELDLYALYHGTLERLEVLGRGRLGVVPSGGVADDRARGRLRALPEGRRERADEFAQGGADLLGGSGRAG